MQLQLSCLGIPRTSGDSSAEGNGGPTRPPDPGDPPVERELDEALEWLRRGPSFPGAEGEAAPRLMLATGSPFVNGTTDGLRDGARAAGAEFALFGTTALPARLLGFERWCFASF
jgi:hypothetical protein